MRCAHAKGLAGCYACESVADCGCGFFATGNKSAKACSLFIQKHGKESLAKTLEKMNDLGLNWNKLLENEKDVKASLGVLETYR